jgi:hypothetical protein
MLTAPRQLSGLRQVFNDTEAEVLDEETAERERDKRYGLPLRPGLDKLHDARRMPMSAKSRQQNENSSS